ncbi:hypothetical protein, partial [Burkholderia pseudomallei]|uniref:hypothetical protein n=1 Tax=Burkholderia pseudomallei TaxID=28450 RepID=UPI0021F6E80C
MAADEDGYLDGVVRLPREPLPAQATTTRGGGQGIRGIWNLPSAPNTRWKGRTIIGYGCQAPPAPVVEKLLAMFVHPSSIDAVTSTTRARQADSTDKCVGAGRSMHCTVL